MAAVLSIDHAVPRPGEDNGFTHDVAEEFEMDSLTRKSGSTWVAKRLPRVYASLPILNILAFVVNLFFNYAAQASWLSKYNLAEISGLYQSLITPASQAFAIWGIIYVWLAVFVVWQAVPKWRDERVVFDEVSLYFIGSQLFSILWLIFFQQGTPLVWICISCVWLFSMVGCMAGMSMRVKFFSRVFDRVGADLPLSHLPLSYRRFRYLQIFLVDIPMSIFWGWITVASILNITLALVGSGAAGFADETNPTAFFAIFSGRWSVAVLALAALIYTIMIFKEGNFVYGFVYVWAAGWIRANALEGCPRTVCYFTAEECKNVEMGSGALLLIIVAFAIIEMARFHWKLWKGNVLVEKGE